MGEKIPEWAKKPIVDFLDQSQHLSDILHLAIHGISMQRGVAGIAEWLRETAGEEDKSKYTEDWLEQARRQESLVNSEVEKGFPVLHNVIATALWSSIESLPRNFLVNWLSNRPEARGIPALSKLKVRLGQYESLTGDDRYSYLLDLLEESLGTRQSYGIARLDALFEVFGFSSTFDPAAKRELLELYHVRNLLVHRNGIADAKFVTSCPWLGLKVGDQVAVTHEAFERYFHAATAYASELVDRVRLAFGHPRRELGSDEDRSEAPPDDLNAGSAEVKQ